MLLYSSRLLLNYNSTTETTLLSLFDDLYKSLDSNLPIQLILLDLSAAFDTIDFDILIERLRSIGIGKVPIKWFSNFIRGRSFSIKINETLSQPYAIKYRVPDRVPLFLPYYFPFIYFHSTNY